MEDVNDNPPVFPQKSYSVTVRENEPPHVVCGTKNEQAVVHLFSLWALGRGSDLSWLCTGERHFLLCGACKITQHVLFV